MALSILTKQEKAVCNLEKLGKCEKIMVCSVCGRRLCHHDDNHCKREGHYYKDGKVTCTGCWYGGTNAGKKNS